MNPSTAFATVVVDELIRCGVREAEGRQDREHEDAKADGVAGERRATEAREHTHHGDVAGHRDQHDFAHRRRNRTQDWRADSFRQPNLRELLRDELPSPIDIGAEIELDEDN